MFGHTRIPRISQDVVKLFRQVAIRSNIPIESFFLPNRSDFLLGALISCAVNDLMECINSPETRMFVSFVRSFALWPWLNEYMHMIGHDAR